MTHAIGVDIGGTGIKVGLVNVETGLFVQDRVKAATPAGGEPEDIARVTRELIDSLGAPADTPVGVAFPSAIVNGVTRLAANVSQRWIDFEAEAFFTRELGREIRFINDADAAGVGEVAFGAAKGQHGLVIVTTLGTGIGTALIYNGLLIPGTELGHIELGGVDAEELATNRVREALGLSWETWAANLQLFYSHIEMLFSPNLFIVGGGVSKMADQYLPLLRLRTPIRAAELRNRAGILGAALLATRDPDLPLLWSLER